jgi:hypothetical protein
MATFIEAFVAYGPRLKRRRTARLTDLSERLADTTGLRASEVMMVLLELREALLHYHRRGTALELPGIGTFSPTLKSDGRIRMLYRPDRALLTLLDNLDLYQGEIENRESIGLDFGAYKARWDAEHPDDPLEPPLGGAVGAGNGTGAKLEAQLRRKRRANRALID